MTNDVDVTIDGVTIRGEQRGDGPPVLLLHGIPETRRMWRHVAPALAEHHTVVATDLRGYGESDAPADTDHSMRALAREQVEVMRALGHERFAVVGHDRGARCAYRMALDHPEAVTHLGVVDMVPTAEAFARADRAFALGYWVWSMLAAPAPLPEQLVAGAPRALVDHMLDTWSDDPTEFGAALREHYTATFRTRPGCTRSASSTAPPRPSTSRTPRPPSLCARSARPSSSTGAPPGPSTRGTTRWRSGAGGPPTSGAAPSTAVTSCPRRRRTR